MEGAGLAGDPVEDAVVAEGEEVPAEGGDVDALVVGELLEGGGVAVDLVVSADGGDDLRLSVRERLGLHAPPLMVTTIRSGSRPLMGSTTSSTRPT